MVDNSLNSMIAQGYAPTADWSKAQQNALSNVMGIQKVQGNQLAMEDALQEMEMRPMKNEMEALKYMEEVAPKIPWETWDASRDWMIKRNKINPNLLPDRAWFDQQAQNNGVDARTYFDFWKNNYWIPGTQRTQMELQRMVLAGKAPEVRPFQEGDEVVEKQWNGQEWVEVSRGKKWNPAEKQPGFKTWIYPDGTIDTIPETQAPPKGSVPYSSGISIETTSPGGETTRVTTGNQGKGSSMTAPPVTAAIQTKIMNGQEQLTRMLQISDEYKPEYQEIGTRLANAWTSIKAKLGRDVDPEDAQAMTEFRQFQRKAAENINLYIKEITGAQMSEAEASRLKLAQPDPGAKWWQGDDPISFKGKMDDVVKMTRAAISRYQFYLSKGLSDPEIRKIINSDAAISLDDLAARMK